MLIFLKIIGFIFLLTFAYAGLSAAPWIPMGKNAVNRCLKLAEIKKGRNFMI